MIFHLELFIVFINLLEEFKEKKRRKSKMAGCLDGIQLPRFEWFELSEKRNAVSSIIAGALVNDNHNSFNFFKINLIVNVLNEFSFLWVGGLLSMCQRFMVSISHFISVVFSVRFLFLCK